MNPEILDYEQLKVITSRTNTSATRAQVIADLTKMKLKFKINAKGDPVSSLAVYNRWLGIKGNGAHEAPDSQSGFEVLSNNG